MSWSTEKWISGSGRRNRLDVNMTVVRRANLFVNRDGCAGVRNEDGKRGEEGPMGGWTVGTSLKVERLGWRGEEPGENIMFPTARGVVYFMIWRAIWHFARGIIHARAARACVYAWILPRLPYAPYRASRDRDVHACARTHAWRIAPRTRVCTRTPHGTGTRCVRAHRNH